MALPFCARDGRYFFIGVFCSGIYGTVPSGKSRPRQRVRFCSGIYGTVAQGKRWGDYANGDDVRDDGSWIAHEQRFAHRLGVGSVGSMID